MRKALWILFLLGGSWLAARAQSPAAPSAFGLRDTLRMGLEDCLSYAFGNSYGRQSVVLNEAAQADRYDQSRKERLPSLSASVSEGYGHTNGSGSSWDGQYGVSTGVTLYQGGNLSETIKQNQLLVEQTGQRTRQYDNELTIGILQAFLTALGNEELLKYQRDVLHVSEEQMRQGKALLAAGSILESDYLLLEAQYATDRNNMVESTINRDNSLSALKSLLSMDPMQGIALVYPDTSAIRSMLALPSEEAVMEQSLHNLPDLQISRYNVEIAASGLKISKTAYYPTLSLSGSVGTGHSNNFSDYGRQLNDRLNEQVGLSLSVPIFNKGRTKSNVTQSRIALQQAALDNKQTELDVRQNILQEYRNVVGAGSKYQATDVRQNAYLASFRAYSEKFRAGTITTVDLLQQQNNYISAMNDYIQSKYGFLLRRKVLDVYMGAPVTM